MSNFVVILVNEKHPTSESGQEMCSAFLVTPHLIMTARHCVQGDEVATGARCGRKFGGTITKASDLWIDTIDDADKLTEARYKQGRRGVSVWVPDDNAACGQDVALVELDRAFDDVTPLGVRLDAPPSVGEKFTAIGYGYDGDAGDGVRRALSNLEVVETTDADSLAPGGWVANRGPCGGDSGSPAIAASDGLVIGVMSRGKRTLCERMIYEHVYTHADWIRNIGRDVSTRAGDPVPTWVSPNGVADAPPSAPEVQTPAAGSGCATAQGANTQRNGAILSALASLLAFAGSRKKKRNGRDTLT